MRDLLPSSSTCQQVNNSTTLGTICILSKPDALLIIPCCLLISESHPIESHRWRSDSSSRDSIHSSFIDSALRISSLTSVLVSKLLLSKTHVLSLFSLAFLLLKMEGNLELGTYLLKERQSNLLDISLDITRASEESILHGLGGHQIEDFQANRSSEPNTFHLFPLLPVEIQDLIWVHTLPDPRVIELVAERLPPCLVPIKKLGVEPSRLKWYNSGAFADIRAAIQRTFLPHKFGIEYRLADFVNVIEKAPRRPPGILSACQNSRAIALDHLAHTTVPSEIEYKAVHHQDSTWARTPSHIYHRTGDIIPTHKLIAPPIWYIPDRDTIYLQSHNLSRIPLGQLGFRDIQSIAVMRNDWDYHSPLSVYLRLDWLLFGAGETPPLFPNVKELVLVHQGKRRRWKPERVAAGERNALKAHTNVETMPDTRFVTESELLAERILFKPSKTRVVWVESYHHLDEV
jgi:hypothetical protein